LLKKAIHTLFLAQTGPYFLAVKFLNSKISPADESIASEEHNMTDIDFKFESFEEYFGDANQVKKTMDECKVCGAKLLLSHMPDYKNLLVQETARCMDCGCGNRRVIHILN
jgi:hypothetical protein